MSPTTTPPHMSAGACPTCGRRRRVQSPDVTGLAQRIVELLADRGEVRSSELHCLTSRNLPASVLRQVLERACEISGDIEVVRMPPSGRGRPPVIVRRRRERPPATVR